MANPIMVPLPKDTWVKVIENVVSAIIHIRNNSPSQYRHTFRTTGDPAPIDDSDSIPIYEHAAEVDTETAVDVYIKAVGADGEVRVDAS